MEKIKPLIYNVVICREIAKVGDIMQNQLRWLHLSDIHFNLANYQSARMRDLLLKYVKDITVNNRFDFLVMTGDIAYRGSRYNKEINNFIDELLDISGIEKKNLFIVPGNHDLIRSQPREFMINGIVQTMDIYDEFQEETESSLLNAQSNFFSFYKDIKGEDYPKDKIHFVSKHSKYNIIHLNTCLISGRENEEGTLKIGLTRLRNALKDVENDKVINIAIGHHGIDCFDDKEQSTIINALIDYGVDMYFCGHIHKPKYHFDADNYRQLPMFVCGANIVDDYAKASFITGEINIESNKAKITYHSFDKEIEKWNIDPSVGRKIVNGSLDFIVERLSNDIDENTYEVQQDIDEDDFKRFLIDFHNYIELHNIKELKFVPKDIEKKFENMRCNNTVKRQYDIFSEYFPVVNEVMDNPNYLEVEKKLIIPNTIVEEYNNIFDEYPTGTKIIEVLTNSILNRYRNRISYPESRLKIYIKTLIYWSIYECDIFDDIKE